MIIEKNGLYIKFSKFNYCDFEKVLKILDIEKEPIIFKKVLSIKFFRDGTIHINYFSHIFIFDKYKNNSIEIYYINKNLNIFQKTKTLKVWKK